MRGEKDHLSYSVVIPAFNEAQRIVETLDQTVRHFEGIGASFEVIVVDDGSADSTGELARKRAGGDSRIRVITLRTNKGKGAAVRTGALASRGERVLITDADLSSPLTELAVLEQALNQDADVAIGSRALPEARLVRRQPWYREWAGRAGNLLIHLAAPNLRDIRDTQCGFKLLRGDVARSLFASQILDRYGFDVEILYLARLRGLKVTEVAVEWAHATGSKVKPYDYLTTMLDVCRIRLTSPGRLADSARRRQT